MKTVALHGGNVAFVDDSDYPSVAPYKWHINKADQGRTYYARCVQCVPGGKGPLKNSFYMHRLVLGISDPKIHIDHINGDTLDNRRENLRICSRRENQGNRVVRPDSSTGYKGVFPKTKNRWIAKVNTSPLGFFKSPEEAARAYDAAALERWGTFARLNFPAEGQLSCRDRSLPPTAPQQVPNRFRDARNFSEAA